MNIIRNEEYLREYFGKDFNCVTEDTLESLGVFLLPHYGHLVCLTFSLSKYKHEIHNDTRNIGAVLHHFSEILNVREDGMSLTELAQAGKKVRSVWIDSPFGPQCVGIGHLWKDEYILFSEFYLAEV